MRQKPESTVPAHPPAPLQTSLKVQKSPSLHPLPAERLDQLLVDKAVLHSWQSFAGFNAPSP